MFRLSISQAQSAPVTAADQAPSARIQLQPTADQFPCVNHFWRWIWYSMRPCGLRNSKYIAYTFTCSIFPKYGEKRYVFQETLSQKQESHSFELIKELNNWLLPSWLWKPPPIKSNLNATVMGADLPNGMVTCAVSFSEKKMLFSQINLKSTH